MTARGPQTSLHEGQTWGTLHLSKVRGGDKMHSVLATRAHSSGTDIEQDEGSSLSREASQP